MNNNINNNEPVDSIYLAELFKAKMNNLINNSGLNAGMVYYIMKDVVRTVEEGYYSAVEQTIMQKEKERQEQAKEQEDLEKENE